MYAAMRKIATAFVFLLSAAVLMGQVATGNYSYGTFDNKGFDTINVGNLNVYFSIPVLNKAERGSPLQYSLDYNSSIWHPVTTSGGGRLDAGSEYGMASQPYFWLPDHDPNDEFMELPYTCPEGSSR